MPTLLTILFGFFSHLGCFKLYATLKAYCFFIQKGLRNIVGGPYSPKERKALDDTDKFRKS